MPDETSSSPGAAGRPAPEELPPGFAAPKRAESEHTPAATADAETFIGRIIGGGARHRVFFFIFTLFCGARGGFSPQQTPPPSIPGFLAGGGVGYTQREGRAPPPGVGQNTHTLFP